MDVLFEWSLPFLNQMLCGNDLPVSTEYPIRDGMKMNKIKNLIRDFEKTPDPFQKLVVLGAIQNELETLKKELSKKIK